METLFRAWSYLSNLEWTERAQSDCKFCDHSKLKPIYQDNLVIAFENIRLGGRHHWLITPLQHIRDIEVLGTKDLPLLLHIDKVKKLLLDRHCPDHKNWTIHSGYHRGRRPISLLNGFYWPDIISIHHLHLHVIVEPFWTLWLFKYPTWLPFMWKSDRQVVQQVERAKLKGD
ncbi:uncharacterized protein F5Z01DRAFT_224310 [Emericellopsis atlantica]|uniref:HIT domain-containing protein n=1 Tax=Emericellopsis atlantica TaxID=2614577 RepID=A0A9P8CMI0_9HYPO|nr:uncharacterized protein F5Z01DRAFT_224310 [Emericellopsis atlantica]KAG9252734.1 hypothetical protein F5Z01DRAFT_224310 [Emericellopsis atlantica]